MELGVDQGYPQIQNMGDPGTQEILSKNNKQQQKH